MDLILFLREWYYSCVESVTDFLGNNGWTIIFALIAVYYLVNWIKPWLSYVYESYEKYRNKREEAAYAAKYYKNPDLFADRLSSQQSYAQKLQEKYDREVEEYKRKQAEKMERKMQEALDKMDGESRGHRLGAAGDKSALNKPLRPESNPLMGHGSSSNYRPQRRTPCKGGGCG